MYRVVKKNGKFIVEETLTGHVIREYDCHDDAHKNYRFLKEGGGFHGWTPAFLLQEIKTELSDNEERVEDF